MEIITAELPENINLINIKKSRRNRAKKPVGAEKMGSDPDYLTSTNSTNFTKHINKKKALTPTDSKRRKKLRMCSDPTFFSKKIPFKT